MQYFPIIQALCRAALATPNDAVRRQVERLRDALKEEGNESHAKALTSLLAGADRTAQMSPSRLVQSTSVITGEKLTPRTLVPVDKESAQPLAEIRFASDLPSIAPILGGDVVASVTGLVEEWQQFELLESAGMSPSRTCLIYGAPGTGKTQLALWIAAQLELPVVLARLDGLISSFLGTTARNIASLFAFAARYECLLLLDEFDAIAKLRDDPQEVGEIKRVVNTLLQNLDTRRNIGFTVGITNHERLLDPAIWRRFEAQLAIPRPTFEARRNIVKAYFSPEEPDNVQQGLLAWVTEGATGAEIEMLVKSVKKRALLSGETGMSPYDLVQRALSLHQGWINPRRQEQLLSSPEELAKDLLNDPDLHFDQSDVATVFSRDRTTISRWVNSINPNSRRRS